MSSSSSKPTSKPTSKPHSSPQPKPSSHLANVELKSRILASLSKLSDRDTHNLAVEDLQSLIKSLPADAFPVVLSSLLHDETAPAIRRESVRLLPLLCASRPDSGAAHLPRIVAHVVRRIKDPLSDASVRDACRDAAGELAALYLGGNEGCASGGAGLFVKPLLEVMGEQSKAAQVGAAAALAKVVECGGGAAAFQRLGSRICKMIGGQSFVAKGALISVLSSLARVRIDLFVDAVCFLVVVVGMLDPR